MPEVRNQDPYATPPVKHDRTGAVVRIAIVAALLGAAAWGYVSFTGQEQAALVPEPAQEQMADAGYEVSPSTLPEATSESLPEAGDAIVADTPPGD